MTFEQRLKGILKNNLSIFFDNYLISVSNDLANLINNPLEENEIAVVIKTTVGTTSKVKDLEETLTNLDIKILCNTNSLQDVLDRLTNYVNSTNGHVMQEDTYIYSLGLEKPFITGEPRGVPGQGKYIRLSLIQLTGACLYTTNSAYKMPHITIGIPRNGEYIFIDVDHVLDVTNDNTQGYDQYSVMAEDGQIVIKYELGANASSWRLTVVKDDSEFQTLIQNYWLQVEKPPLKIRLDNGTDVDVYLNSFTEVVNGGRITIVYTFIK